MSVSLYRKYRPTSFDEVLGQDAIVQSLQSVLTSGNLSHAYLFAGSRGTGKTSVARIFAQELGVSSSDIYEIDAASNNGVDEIRELTSSVSTLPFDSKYKIYILDEVHMLSKSSFNALLKTLEEPPAHVIFILATTELHKVLDTVKSRCQIFEFKKPTIEILVALIESVTKKEKVTIDSEAVRIIARRGDGAFRDTLGLLERVIQSSDNKKISSTDVEKILSAPHHELVHEFVKALINKDLNGSLDQLHKISDQGQPLDHFLEQVLQICRIVLLVRFSPEFAKTLTISLSDTLQIDVTTWAGEKNIINADLLVEFIDLLQQVKKTSLPVIVVELALIRILGHNRP